MAFWMNVHGSQLHPKIAIYVGKQLKNYSHRLGTVLSKFKIFKTYHIINDVPGI